VTGKFTPDIEKPVPASIPALMVSAAVPEEVSVIDCGVAALFTFTLPKLRLSALSVSPGAEAFNCTAKLSVTLAAVAVSVAACAVLTAVTAALNVALGEPAATLTVDGTVTALLLLARLTVNPPVAAAAFSVTVQLSVPDPVNESVVQLSPLNTGTPVPLREMVVEPPLAALLVRVTVPLSAPLALGSKPTVRVAV